MSGSQHQALQHQTCCPGKPTPNMQCDIVTTISSVIIMMPTHLCLIVYQQYATTPLALLFVVVLFQVMVMVKGKCCVEVPARQRDCTMLLDCLHNCPACSKQHTS